VGHTLCRVLVGRVRRTVQNEMNWRESLKQAVAVHGPKAIVYAANATGKLEFESHDLHYMRAIDRVSLDRVISEAHKASERAFLEYSASRKRHKK
jgi:hypothetical protein